MHSQMQPKPTQSSPGNMSHMQGGMHSQTQMQTQLNNKYKTQRCWHFDNNGNCQMGDKCHFAHGDAELRDPNQPIPFELLPQAQRRVPTGPRKQHGPGLSGGYENTRGGYRKPYRGGGGPGKDGQMGSGFKQNRMRPDRPNYNGSQQMF